MSPDEIKQHAKEGAIEGANEVLKKLGLDDGDAIEDIKAIRGWLDSYRLFKRAAVQTTAKIFTAGFWILLFGGAISWLSTHLKIH